MGADYSFELISIVHPFNRYENKLQSKLNSAVYLGLNMESESQILSYLMNSKERRYAHHVHSILSF